MRMHPEEENFEVYEIKSHQSTSFRTKSDKGQIERTNQRKSARNRGDKTAQDLPLRLAWNVPVIR